MGGDESAFEALYVNHRQAIWAYFFASCHDRDLAMDGVQDVFLQAWRCIDRLCVLSPVQQKAWIYQTAGRRLIDSHRHQIVVDRENSKVDCDFHNPISADPGRPHHSGHGWGNGTNGNCPVIGLKTSHRPFPTGSGASAGGPSTPGRRPSSKVQYDHDKAGDLRR